MRPAHTGRLPRTHSEWGMRLQSHGLSLRADLGLGKGYGHTMPRNAATASFERRAALVVAGHIPAMRTHLGWGLARGGTVARGTSYRGGIFHFHGPHGYTPTVYPPIYIYSVPPVPGVHRA